MAVVSDASGLDCSLLRERSSQIRRSPVEFAAKLAEASSKRQNRGFEGSERSALRARRTAGLKVMGREAIVVSIWWIWGLRRHESRAPGFLDAICPQPLPVPPRLRRFPDIAVRVKRPATPEPVTDLVPQG